MSSMALTFKFDWQSLQTGTTFLDYIQMLRKSMASMELSFHALMAGHMKQMVIIQSLWRYLLSKVFKVVDTFYAMGFCAFFEWSMDFSTSCIFLIQGLPKIGSTLLMHNISVAIVQKVIPQITWNRLFIWGGLTSIMIFKFGLQSKILMHQRLLNFDFSNRGGG